MPDTFANPYADSPIGAALKNLSNVITRGPNEAQNVLRAEAALKLKQQRENTVGLGDMFRSYGTPAFDPGAATDMAIRGNVSPDHLGGYARYNAATRYGAASPITDNAVVGAGGSFNQTAGAFHENQTNDLRKTQMGIDQQRYQFDNTPVNVGTDQGPVIARRSEAYGQPAIEPLANVKGNVARVAVNSPGGLAAADPTTQNFIGADGKNRTPHNYVSNGQNFVTYDGVTDARTGQPLPQGGYLANAQGGSEEVGLTGNKSIDREVLNSRVAAQTAGAMIDRLTTSLQQPDAARSTGWVGSIARTFNDVRSQVEATVGALGGQDSATSFASPETQHAVDGAVQSIFGNAGINQRAQQLGISASILRSQIQDLAYTIAKAQDPGGRVSVDDIRRAADTVGASIMDPQAAIPVLQDLKGRINTQQQIREQVTRQMFPQLRGGDAPQAPAAPAPGVAPSPAAAPGAPTSDPLADARAAIAKGADPNAVRQRLQQHGINPAGL